MHPTRDTTALIKRNLVGGQVMPSVRWLRVKQVAERNSIMVGMLYEPQAIGPRI
ncbi:MAG: hypothetical protein QOH49_4550 [Acidobacteriota bacterium]|jgi:hypothetical protein|nr:hypothetical protein [Acidobacteriota bacterium]